MTDNMFGYPSCSLTGETVIVDRNGIYKNMLQDVSVLKLRKGEVKNFYSVKDETAVLLLEGNIIFCWETKKITAKRKNVFEDNAFCLHFPRQIEVVIIANEDSEILIQKTENEKNFQPVFYEKGKYRDEIFGQGLCDNVAVRQVTTFFDYDNAPYSNMVMGEVYSNQGGWSGFLPHSHRQPEVYYYRFDHPNGFGACFIGDNVFKVVDKSFCAIPGGLTHPQVSAPGYRMYYVWMIRHLPQDPWVDRELDKKHIWLKDKKDFIKI